MDRTARFDIRILLGLALVLAFAALPLFAQDAHAYPEYGEEEGFSYRTENGEATVTGIDEKKAINHVTIPAKLGGCPVTAIDSFAFNRRDRMTGISIPKSVKTIGSYAFYNCDWLETIQLPEGITSIENSTFSSCDSLETVCLPSTLTYFGDYVFSSTPIKDIYFAGSKSQWNAISFGSKNEEMDKATIHYNSKYSTGSSSTSTPTSATTTTIKPKATSITTATGFANGFTVKWKPQTAKVAGGRITGYEVRISLSSKMTSPMMMTAKGYSTKYIKVRGLQAKKKFYVQVRTYKTVSGKVYYSSWSAKKAVRTK